MRIAAALRQAASLTRCGAWAHWQMKPLQDAFDAADPAEMEHPLVNLTLASSQRRGRAGRLLTAVDAYAYDSVWAVALGIILDADSGSGNLAGSIRALHFSGASGAISFNSTGDRGPAGLVVWVENVQAMGGLGGFAWGEVNWSRVLLVSTPVGVVDLALGFNRSAQDMPSWPGGLQSWTAPADYVDVGQRSEMMFFVIFLLLGALVLFLVYMYVSRSEQADQALTAKMIELRVKLGITRQHGFVLGSERAPIWRRREDITFMQMSFMEAAGRLALFQDFDVNLFDNFCVCVKSSSRLKSKESRLHYDSLCEWLLEVSKECLLPLDSDLSLPNEKPKNLFEGLLAIRRLKQPSLVKSSASLEGRAHSVSGCRMHEISLDFPPSRQVLIWGDVATADSLTKARLDYSEFQTSHQRLREERFKFFRDKVAKVKLWRDDEGMLFEKLKLLMQDLMAELTDQCNLRYATLCHEAMGQELTEFSDAFDLGSKVYAVLEQKFSALTALNHGMHQAKEMLVLQVTLCCPLQSFCLLFKLNLCAILDRSEGQFYFDGIYPKPNRVGFKDLFRQDNTQVSA